MATCELGGHYAERGTRVLRWCCTDCLDIYRKNRGEIAEQAEVDRQFKLDNRRSPYVMLPYYGLTLAFIAFLIVFFL